MRWFVWVLFAGVALTSQAHAACTVTVSAVTANSTTVSVDELVVIGVSLTYGGCKDTAITVRDNNPSPALAYNAVCSTSNSDWNCTNVTTVAGVTSTTFTPSNNGNNRSSIISLTYKATSVGAFAFTLANNISASSNGVSVTVVGVVPPAPLADWRMDETTAYSGVTGEVKNSVSGGTNGIARRSATNLPLTAAFPGNISGKLCGGVQFNGVNYFEVAGLSSQLSGTASLSFWINTMQTGGTSSWTSPGVTGVEQGGGGNDIFWGWINPTGKIALNKGNTLGAQSASSINTGTWRHIVLTRNQVTGETKIYVDGVLESTRNSETGLVTTAFSSIGRMLNARNLIGALDEVKIFATVLSNTQAASIYANESAGNNWDGEARVCPVSGPHHLEIQHSSGTGLTCAASTLTVRACADAACTAPYNGGVSGMLTATGAPTVNWDGTSGGATGAGFVIAAGASSVTKNVQVASVGTVVFGTSSSVSPAATNATTCNFGSPSCTFTAGSAGFLFSNTATGNTFTIPTQVAGTATNTIFLRAVKSASTNAAICTPAIISQAGVGITMGYSCNNPSSCQPGSLLTVNATAVSPSGSSVSMNFDANGSSPITLNYDDVGQITVNASKSITPTGGTAVTLNGSSNAFVVKPGGFVLSNIKCTTHGATTCAPTLAAPGNNPAAASAAGAAFIQAGQNFSATVTATTSGGATTPNYGKETSPESVKLTSALVTGQGLTNNPTLTNNTAFGSFASGVASGTTFSWGDVGIITLTPSVGDADYLGAGDVTGTTSGNVGRFIPDHFTLVSSSIVPAFAYMAQPFTVNYAIEARNGSSPSIKTSNYAGTFAPGVVSVAAENNNNGTDLVARLTGPIAAWSSGSYSVTAPNNATFARGGSPVSPDGPYGALAFGVKVIDSDGPVLHALDMNPATTATDVACVAGGTVTNCTHKRIGSTQIRFGQMVLFPGYGSELVDLAMRIQMQYWNGSAFAINALDSSTTIAGAQIGFAGLTPAKVAPSASTPLTIAGGAGVLKLNSSGTIGKAQVTIDMSSMPWFLGNSGGAGGYTTPPSAPAVFGLYKKSNKVIFSRERY